MCYCTFPSPLSFLFKLQGVPVAHLLLEVEEVGGLVDEEDLQSRAAQVVPPQVDLADQRQRPLEVITNAFRSDIRRRTIKVKGRRVRIKELDITSTRGLT